MAPSIKPRQHKKLYPPSIHRGGGDSDTPISSHGRWGLLSCNSTLPPLTILLPSLFAGRSARGDAIQGAGAVEERRVRAQQLQGEQGRLRPRRHRRRAPMTLPSLPVRVSSSPASFREVPLKACGNHGAHESSSLGAPRALLPATRIGP